MMFLYFPYMHPEFMEKTESAPAVDGALHVDPGLDGAEEGAYRPQGLPLDEEKARRLVLDALHFGDQFRKPGDMTAMTLHEEAARQGESASAIQQQLLSRLGGELAASEEVDRDDLEALGRAQFTLLLGWAWEERMMDMLGLERELGDVWTRFGDSLGIRAEDIPDQKELELDRTVSDLSEKIIDKVVYPWRRTLAALSLLLPDDCVLLAVHQDALDFWKGEGVDFAESGESAGLDDDWKVTRQPVWRLLGRSGESRGSRHLNRTITVAVPAKDIQNT